MGQDTNCTLVEEVMEDIVCLECLLPGLFVAKDEINPLVEMSRHIVTLQSLLNRENSKLA